MEHREHCRELMEFLSDYVDGTLEAQLCAEIERHMSGCENCTVVVDTLKKTVYLYQATSSNPEMPAEIRQRLYHRLELDEFLNA
jgi:anti-sigma factor RsiW